MATPAGAVRVWTVRYRAHNGLAREAHIALPRDLGPANNPPVPLIISPHGRESRAREPELLGRPARARSVRGDQPRGPRAGAAAPLVGLGAADRRSRDMQYVAKATLPWLRIRPHSVYAMGGSMGGQETLLLVARFNTLLAGAVALDSPTDLARRYRDFARLSNGRSLQELARREVGDISESVPGA